MPVIRSRSSWSTVPSRSFLHWSGPQMFSPAGDIWKVVIVCKVKFQNRMPLRSWASTEEPTSPNAIEASNTARILASRRLMHWFHGASEQRASLTQETVDILRLGKVFGSIEPDWVYEP